MEKCDSFWQWRDAQEKFFSCENSPSADVFDKMAISEVPAEKGIWKRRRCVTSSLIRRSERDSAGNTLKSGRPCRYVNLHVRSSFMGDSPCKNDALVEVNYSMSPISSCQGYVFSSDASTNSSDTLLSHSRGDSSPELYSSTEKRAHPRVLCDRKSPSNLMARRIGEKPGASKSCLSSDNGNFTRCRGEISVDVSSSCSVSGKEAAGMQSQSCFNSMRKLRVLGNSEPSSSRTNWFSRGQKTRQILISKESFECPTENSKLLFEDLHMLADLAIRGLVPSFKEERIKASSEQWVGKAVCSPIGIFFWQKRVVRRAKSAFKYVVSPSISVGMQKSADSKSLSASELCSFGSLNPQENLVTDGFFGDNDQGGVQKVRCCKRSRSQFLNVEYCDSVL